MSSRSACTGEANFMVSTGTDEMRYMPDSTREPGIAPAWDTDMKFAACSGCGTYPWVLHRLLLPCHAAQL